MLGAGNPTLSVTLTPTDIADYTTATASVTLEVDPATPTITWVPPEPITYGTALSPAQLNATDSVPGTFAYSPAVGTVLGAGTPTLSLTFTPTDSTDYTTATATVPLTVNKATPTITWPTPADILYGTPLSATQLDATASVPGTLAYTPAAGTLLQPGAQTLTVTSTDTTDYTTATDSTQVNIVFSQPCITTKSPGPLTVTGGEAICVAAGGKISGPATVQAGGALWVNGGTLSSSITVQTGGVFWITGGTISGKLNSIGARALTACGTTMSGAVTVESSTGAVLFGGGGCSGDDITAPVDITDNSGGLSFVGNNVSASVTITDNSGGFQYADNTVSGSATISGNT